MSASAEPQHKINVTYANGTASSYIITTETGQKYVLYQKYAWQDNLHGRFSLVGYSMDDGPKVQVTRHGNGNFTLDVPTDADHSITFFALQQFEITSHVANMTLAPTSPTGDNWFDKDSEIHFVVPYVIQSSNASRYQLVGWSQDSSVVNIITRQEVGSFRSAPIRISDNYNIDPQYKEQFYVNVISEFGKPLGTGWYDSGTIAEMSVMPSDESITRHLFAGWQGQVIGNGKQYSVNVLVDSPKVLVANWVVDYTNISLVSIIAIAVVVVIVIYLKRKGRTKI